MPDRALREHNVILVVDDQPSDAEVLREAVTRLGQTLVAHSSDQALELARRFRPDVVLLDIQMPVLDGLAICRKMKDDPKLCDAAIIFVTAHSQPMVHLRAMESGGIDFVHKPVDPRIVRARVRAHLELRTQAKRLAYFDAITGLPNRVLLNDRIQQAVHQAVRKNTQVSLVLLNLDDFQSINNHSGHELGDKVLHAVARRLETLDCNHIDSIGRPFADVFAILIVGAARVGEIRWYVEELLEKVALPFLIDGIRFDLSACAGVSVYPDDGTTYSQLLSHAEAAMYQAKKQGRSRYRFYSEALETTTRARLLLERHMREALEQGVFQVFYQPMYDIKKRQFCRMEALVRWRQADGTVVSPAEFIPIAEDTELIVPLGQYVLSQACTDAVRLMNEGVSTPVSVNISALQFREGNFLQMVQSALSESGLPAEMLELEITEGAVADDFELAQQILAELRATGVRVAIDDFGTGYSSLGYLRRLPIDVLKIDQSFVRDMLVDASAASIVRAIVRLGQALNLELVAEGVEVEQQAARLQDLGCDVMQGYLYARPCPFEELRPILSA